MFKTSLTTILIALFFTSGYAQPDNYLLRTVSLSPDGSQVAFSYQGDIWKAALSDGTAQRLTVHESYEFEPQWSPDGNTISFTSNRHGNNDIFLLSLKGNPPTRLTHHSTGDNSAKWAPDGNLIFCTRRAFVQLERERELHKISTNGGTPMRIMDAVGDMPSVSPNGKFIAFTRGSCRIAREAYTGPANRNIWIYNTQNRTYHQITDLGAMEIYPDWGDDMTLYYLSAENGRYNINRIKIDANGNAESEPVALTKFKDEGIRFFDVSANGQMIVYEKGSDVYTVSTTRRESPKKVKVSLALDDKFYANEFKTLSKGATNYTLSPNEKYVAYTVRGEIFIKENDKEKKRSVRITNHAYRDQDPGWLNDSTLIFVSDRNGTKDLFIVRSKDEDQPNLFKTFKRSTTELIKSPENIENYYLSPDGNQIAIRKGRGQLTVSDIDSTGNLTNEKVLLDGWDIPEGVAWSPDSKWLAYALEDLNFNEEIYIHPADNSHEGINVTYHPRSDGNPVWSRDGSKLGFTSIRNNGDSDVWFVWLKEEDWEKTRNDWEELDDEEESNGDKKKGKDKEKVDPIQIDFENIHERLVQVTRLPGNEGNMAISKDGETFFFTTNGGGRQGSAGDPELMSIKWNGEDQKSLQKKASVGNIRLDKSGKYLYMGKRGGTLARLKIDGAKMENLPFSAKMQIDYHTERQQIFDEAWRSLDAGFYDPQFHGQDFEKLRAHYEPIALSASTSQDFRLVFNEMLGQLNASHMGMSGPDPEETNNDRTGLLGIEFEPTVNGLTVKKIVPDTPADKKESKLMDGDVITHINEMAITPTGNFYQMLNQTGNERILLTLNRSGQTEEIIIRPTTSIRSQLYNEWVKERRRLTDEYSDGKLGYIHIQGMNWPSFERFERELAASGQGKDGIVIDVRFNGGGWTTDMLMAVLNVRQHSYTIPRGAVDNLDKQNKDYKNYYPFGERLPLSSWTKPSIALCNQNSYSNAEIFSHAFKTLDIGTLVGTPTFGAVISTGSQRLIDGSRVRMPFRAWYVKATGENMEHGPAVPDVIIENAPDSKAKGEDPQLKKAVELLLQEIKGT